MALHSHSRLHPGSSRASERGYVLLALMLLVALIIIAAAAIVPTIAFEIRRDREEEMIHRGVQYSRAIRAYYKKFGRYPTRLEDLESSNNLRFLRKRYKDPITGQDFKILHFGEVKLSFTGGIGGGTIPGANPLNGQAGGLNGAGGFGQPSSFGGASGFGGNSPGTGSNINSPGSSPGQSGSGQSGFGQSSFGQSSPGQPSQNPPSATDSQSSPSPQNPGVQASDQNTTSQGGPGGSISSNQLGGQTLGGGPIVGVASASKKESIREFNNKRKYEEWQFVYDPSSDRGGLLSTPNQPPLKGSTQQQQPGQSQQNGVTPTTSGPIPGMLNNPNQGMEPTGSGAPTPPPNPPPQ
ncbi:MAG TPA: hypothetical protein VI386_07815 [Candidatus Sulfotelmatobacter sp.]